MGVVHIKSTIKPVAMLHLYHCCLAERTNCIYTAIYTTRFTCYSQNIKMLQNEQMTFLLHLCVCIMVLINSSLSNQYPPIVTPNYMENGQCPTGIIPTSFCPDVEELQINCQQPLELDKCGYCMTCPHLEAEPCGGPYYIHGVCSRHTKKTLICLNADTGEKVPRAEVMSGVNVTGRCRPNSCSKDCSTRKNKWMCGSDGVWRYNPCYLNALNCNWEKGLTQIVRARDNTICGPMPTVAILPKPTSVKELSTSSKVIVEPSSVSSIFKSSASLAGNSEQTRTLIYTTTQQPPSSNHPVNNRPLSLD